MAPALRIRLFQTGVMLIAALPALVFIHWFIVQPVPLLPREHELPILIEAFFRLQTPWSGIVVFHKITLGITAITGLSASVLATVLAIRAADQIAARRLALSLSFASYSVGYFFFGITHAEYRAAIGWQPEVFHRLLFDLSAYGFGFLSAVFILRFFVSYPRSATVEEWEAFFQHQLVSSREKMRAGGGHYKLLPESIRTRWANSKGGNTWFRYLSDADQARRSARFIQFIQSNTAVVLVAVLAIVCAIIDWLDASQCAGKSLAPAIFVIKKLGVFLAVMLNAVALDGVQKCLQKHSGSLLPEERLKIDWIKSTLLVGGVLFGVVYLGSTILSILTLGKLAERDIFIPGAIVMLGPTLVAFQLYVLAFVISLAMSIFYRGAIDPRLAARKITVFGVLGLLVAFLFVLIERTVALKIVAFFNLSPDMGALIAGASVAATVAPIRNRAEKIVTIFVGRFLPLDSLIEGERKVIAVALSDLSGYTALSSRDEKQALLMAALLQRQAQKVTDAHGGRVVKSMGDAILFAFDDASTAVKVLAALHRDFAPAAEQVGLVPLPLHSGAHVGEVTVAHDGDIYGQTVNVAARIQGIAPAGQIVVSDAFATAAGSDGFRVIGPRRFKNVPLPIACLELSTPHVDQNDPTLPPLR